MKDGRKDRAYREPLAAQSGHYGKECRAGDALSHMRAGVFPEPGEQTIPVSVWRKGRLSFSSLAPAESFGKGKGEREGERENRFPADCKLKRNTGLA